MKHLLIDHGGTNFRYVVVSDLLNPIKREQIVKKTSQEIDLKEFLLQFRDDKLTSIRISIAGQIKDGVIKSSPNIGLQDFDIQTFVKQNFTKTDLFIENDLNCAALAENDMYKSENLGVYYIGTGFGASAISGGCLIKGANNLANEIGHLPFKKSDKRCSCGNDDCIELFCSGKALERRCHQVDTNLSYHNLQKLKKSPDPYSPQIYEDFLNGLFLALQVSITLYDFDTIVLGGSVIKNNLFLKELIQTKLKTLAFAKQREIKVYISTLDEGSLEGTRFL